jgi:8-oxo-dGTP pyrophosphatase MutT (NUDIX family)
MALGAREQPIPRPAARVLLLDARDRLLLFHITDPRAEVRSLWVTPGGALEPGEDDEAAARRELAEETGLEGVPLGPLVWRRTHVFRLGDEWYESQERFYLVRVDTLEVSTDGHTALEREVMRTHRWWSRDEIAHATDEVFVPRAMASLLGPIVRGDLPDPPIEVGA